MSSPASSNLAPNQARHGLSTHASSPPVLVIGYGNTLRGDDGVGRVAADRLAHLLDADLATVVSCHQLTPELSNSIRHARYVIFVDAAAAGAPGHIAWRDQTPSPGTRALSLDHHLTPQSLLALTAHLFGGCPPGCLFTISGQNWDRPDRLSPPVRAALSKVVDSAARLAADHAGLALHRI